MSNDKKNPSQKKVDALAPNYGKLTFKEKLTKRLRNEFAKIVYNTYFQFKAYPSYWHYQLNKKKIVNSEEHYLTQKPDYGAGIGHQLANWNSGFYFAGLFGLNFAHTPFSAPKWESLLGFGEGEVLAQDLMDSSEFKKVRLPRFDSNNAQQIQLISNIIKSYSSEKVLFLFEMNQGYANQFETAPLLSKKFFEAEARTNDKFIFNKNVFNIAIHIRQRMKIENDVTWKYRGLDNSYFAQVLKSTLRTLDSSKKIEIYIFSQGLESDFPEFSEIANIHFCLDMNPYDSFLHMVNADLLISSKSSFSYKPALISKNIKICPKTFWHFYPDTSDYIKADNQGAFDLDGLNNQLGLIK
jgi:hypothetical protein